MAIPVGVAAIPPKPVSLNSRGICLPTLYMASITSSALMRLFTPANAMSAAAKAFAVQWRFSLHKEFLPNQRPDRKLNRVNFVMQSKSFRRLLWRSTRASTAVRPPSLRHFLLQLDILHTLLKYKRCLRLSFQITLK